MKDFTLVITVTVVDNVPWYTGTCSFFYKHSYYNHNNEERFFLNCSSFSAEGKNQLEVHDSLVEQAVAFFNEL